MPNIEAGDSDLSGLDTTTIDRAIVERAQALADDVLFPGALAVDELDQVPEDRLQAIADAGFYGIFAPPAIGGLGANGPTLAAVVEALCGGCSSTALVWVQHMGPLGNVLFGPEHLQQRYLADLTAGRVRGGIAFAGLLPGPPKLTAEPTDGGWLLHGQAPWVSGWGRIHVLHVAARGPDDTIVNVLIDAVDQQGLCSERLRLGAVDASSTVHLTFDEYAVPAQQVLGVQPYDPAASLGASLRTNGSMALGVAARCCRLIGPSPLDEQLDARRAGLDTAAPEAMATERALTSAFAVRAATALMAHVGSRAIRRDDHAQRLAREAQFLIVFGSRPMIRDALLTTTTTPRS